MTAHTAHGDLSDAPITGEAYGLMFPELPALATDKFLIRGIGGLRGISDGSQRADTDDDDGRDAAGWPIFGQFVAHDITADRSALAMHADIGSLRNRRRHKINLEFLYGTGPDGEPYLYDADDPPKLLLGDHDVQRNSQGFAIIGDPRNDSHLMMSQMHYLFCRFHNALVDWVREQHTPAAEIFPTAQRLARWHYQWIVLRDFLPRLIGASLADDLLRNGPSYFDPAHEPFIPLEFAAAAYRYGHGQIRHFYQVNADSPPVPLFPDLVGFRPVPPTRTVDWGYFFDLPNRAPAQRVKRLDGRLTGALMYLPEAISGAVDTGAHRALSVRDLQRGQAVGLASGEAVARRMGVPVLTRDETGLAELGWEHETPLWYYVLKEAAIYGNGDQLGPVGGRIVGDVLVGLIASDATSYLGAGNGWTPELPAMIPGQFSIADLIAFTRERFPATLSWID